MSMMVTYVHEGGDHVLPLQVTNVVFVEDGLKVEG